MHYSVLCLTGNMDAGPSDRGEPAVSRDGWNFTSHQQIPTFPAGVGSVSHRVLPQLQPGRPAGLYGFGVSSCITTRALARFAFASRLRISPPAPCMCSRFIQRHHALAGSDLRGRVGFLSSLPLPSRVVCFHKFWFIKFTLSYLAGLPDGPS